MVSEVPSWHIFKHTPKPQPMSRDRELEVAKYLYKKQELVLTPEQEDTTIKTFRGHVEQWLGLGLIPMDLVVHFHRVKLTEEEALWLLYQAFSRTQR